jgi:dihydroxyacetone kinase-like protein
VSTGVATSTRKFLNDPADAVKESLAGFATAHGRLLRYDAEARIVVRADAPVRGKVGVVSGGGSGHEPLHGGFVGRGMLDAACPGEVFTSPAPQQVIAATSAVAGGAGVIYIVKNYTGDVINFKLAADRAAERGIEVESVVIDDDVAIEASADTAGRRGVGATLLAEKLVGAAADRGYDLASVAEIARRVKQRGRSFGVALSSCTPPAAAHPLFDLPDDEMEIGVGIHGEPGRYRESLAPAREIADLMVEAVVSDLGVRKGAPLLAFVNGMGGTPQMELYILYGEIARHLNDRGLRITRNLVGNYITSLEMAGASLTLLELDEELAQLWDAPVDTPGLRW